MAVIGARRRAWSVLGTSWSPLIPAKNWDGTRVILPCACSPANSTGLFGASVVSPVRELKLSAVLSEFPVNVLIEHN